MSDWKAEIARIKSGIDGLHGAIEKYLELTGNPDRVSVDDLEIICQLTETFPSKLDQNTLQVTLGEFMVYYGFDPVPTDDGFFEKLPRKKND